MRVFCAWFLSLSTVVWGFVYVVTLHHHVPMPESVCQLMTDSFFSAFWLLRVMSPSTFTSVLLFLWGCTNDSVLVFNADSPVHCKCHMGLCCTNKSNVFLFSLCLWSSVISLCLCVHVGCLPPTDMTTR